MNPCPEERKTRDSNSDVDAIKLLKHTHGIMNELRPVDGAKIRRICRRVNALSGFFLDSYIVLLQTQSVMTGQVRPESATEAPVPSVKAVGRVWPTRVFAGPIALRSATCQTAPRTIK